MPFGVQETYRPAPGTDPKDLEIPGPGLYEADFDVPGWLLPDFDSGRRFDFKVREHRITHHWSRVRGSVLTVRFAVEREGDVTNLGAQTAGIFAGLTVAVVLRFAGPLIFGALAVKLVGALASALRELRKLGETPAGVGLAALGVGAGVLLLVSALATSKGG